MTQIHNYTSDYYVCLARDLRFKLEIDKHIVIAWDGWDGTNNHANEFDSILLQSAV